MTNVFNNLFSEDSLSIINKKNNEIKTENKFLNGFFTCPICSELLNITLNPLQFDLSYKCANNHSEKNIPFEIFYSKNYITEIQKTTCKECNKDITDICFYHSNDGIILCQKCASKIAKKYNHRKFILTKQIINHCNQHNKNFSKYCKTCKKDLCELCINDKKNVHLNHIIETYENIFPKKEEIESNDKRLKGKIKINMELIEKLDKWKEEINKFIQCIINKLDSEIKIYELIKKNFDMQLKNYNSFMNYKNLVLSLKVFNNKFLEQLMEAHSFVEITKIIYKYIKRINDNGISNQNNNNYNINNYNDKNEIKENNISLINILENGEKILCFKENIYKINENDKKSKIVLNNIITNFQNKQENKLAKNLIKLRESLIRIIPNMSILIWKNKYDQNTYNFLPVESEVNHITNKKLSVEKIEIQILKSDNRKNIPLNYNIFHSISGINNDNNNNISEYDFASGTNQLLFNPVNPDRSDENKVVYISKTGKRYHCTDKCGQMKSGSKKSLKEAKSLGYTACCICIKEGNVKS